MNNEIGKMIADMMEQDRIEKEQRLIKYPPDVPNTSGYHAFIKGIKIENSFGPIVGDYNFLFQTKFEKIYIWTHTKNENSAIISDINISVRNKEFWKTVGSMIKLSLAYDRYFQEVDFDSKLEYKIIYYFSPDKQFDSLVFSNVSHYDTFFLFDGQEVKATKIANLSPIIELLNRDDRCFTALSLLFSSFQLHYFCLICELGLLPYKKHQSHEPELWENADHITNMESAIVQACRCAEALLGEPPNQGKQSRIVAHKQKWIDLLGINPDDIFERVGISYWNFYLKLFDELRNPSAHSYGNIHFDLERKHTIDAQCFATIILSGYIEQNTVEFDEAMDILKFDREFLSRVQLKMSTPLTKQ